MCAAGLAPLPAYFAAAGAWPVGDPIIPLHQGQATRLQPVQGQGFGSRRQCRQLIELGEVRIQGEVVDNPGIDVATVGLVFEVEGETWVYREKTYLALHKPAGYECSHEPKHHRGVYSLLQIGRAHV